MNITEVITVISALTIVIGIAVSLLNKRIDNLRQDMDKRLDRLEQDMREIRQLLLKVLEVPHKEDK